MLVPLLAAAAPESARGQSGGVDPAPYGPVLSGTTPIAGATVELYAVGTTGDGSPASPLLTAPVTTDANGVFNLDGLYACPSPSTLIYLAVTGGKAGSYGTPDNPATALLAALGPCGAYQTDTRVIVNELTTAAAVNALLPFVRSASEIGAGPGESQPIADGFALAREYANVQVGFAPGTGLPPGTSVQVAKLNTVADLLSICTGVSGYPSSAAICSRC